jgi:hypothetical protein
VQLTLGRLNLQSLAVSLGAGDLMLDLRGMPAKSYKDRVKAGKGDTTIQLPAGGRNFSEQRPASLVIPTSAAIEQRDGRWINARAKARLSRSIWTCNTRSVI